MATINAIGSAKPIQIEFGGTLDATLGAFQILTGGTTGTNPVQNVSGTGTAAQVLTSNGAGILPTWQAQGPLIIPNYTPPTAWTPTVVFGSGGITGVTYASRSGLYMIIGKLVFFTCSFALTNKGSGGTGSAGIFLPVLGAAGKGFSGSYVHATNMSGLGASGVAGIGVTGGASTVLQWIKWNFNSPPGQNRGQPLARVDFTNTSTISCSGVYYTD